MSCRGHKHIPHVVVTRESSLLASMLDGYSLTFVIAAEISTPGSLSVCPSGICASRYNTTYINGLHKSRRRWW